MQMKKVKIIQDFIPIGTMSRIGEKRKKKWIVIHETGNTSPRAGAKNHANWLQNVAKANNEYRSWHYTVDDSVIYQHMPDDEVAFHASDGNKSDGGNYSGIGIEICVNPESVFSVAIDNAAMLTANLLKKHKLDMSAVKQHHDFARDGKNCTYKIRTKELWKAFLGMVNGYLNLKEVGKVDEKQLQFSMGDKVILNGYAYRDSYASRRGMKFTNMKCEISRIVDSNRAAPYLLNNTLGWAREQDLTYQTTGQPKEVVEGSTVRVSGKLYTTSYAGVAARTISGVYKVTMIIPERTAGVLLNGNFGWVRIQDCVAT